MFPQKLVNHKKAKKHRTVIPSVDLRRGQLPLMAALVLALFSLSAGLGNAGAQEVQTLDFPFKHQDSKVPEGLAAWPVETFEGLARIEIPLRALPEEGALLVTVVFEDAEDRILLAKWVGSDLKTTDIVDNMSENVIGLSQRTLEIGYENLAQAGSLVFETDAEAQPIKRIVLTWTWPTGVFSASSAQGVKYVAGGKRLYTGEEFSPARGGAIADTWSAGIWKAFLQEQVEPLGEPLQFGVPMDTVPSAVIFRTKALGIPLNASVSVWVNGREVRSLTFQTPELSVAGYYEETPGELKFAGWREAAVVIPGDYFVAGENAIVLPAQKGAYLKDSLLELNFEKEGAPLALTPASFAAPVTVHDMVRSSSQTGAPKSLANKGPLIVVPPAEAAPPPEGIDLSEISIPLSGQSSGRDEELLNIAP